MPESKLKKVWDKCIILMLAYLITVDLYVMAFVTRVSIFISLINIVVDIAFVVDIFVNFISAYTNVNGRLET